MPIWLLPLLIKYVLPFVLSELVKSGAMNQIEADGIKSFGDFINWIKGLKTYYQPADFPSESSKGQQ